MKKPFEFGAGGVIGDVGLTLKQKAELKLHLDEKMLKVDKVRFLDAVSVAVDRASKSIIFHGNEAEALKRIKNFSAATHEMALAIDGLKATTNGKDQDPFQYLGIYFDESLYLNNPGMRLRSAWRKNKPNLEDILNNLQGEVTDLENLADYTVTKIKISKGSRPVVKKSRIVALEVLKAYQATFGAFPLISRGSWFANFMAELGLMLNLEIGDRVLSYVKRSIV